MENDRIIVRGARVHNLKNLDCDLPHFALTVVSGVSGSGKSSLAFDTIYAEGQRRYVESLSAYARQFLERIEKPDVDSIEGLAPAIAIRQKNSTRNPRSTVGTATEIYDYMRLLYARCGTTYCSICGNIVRRNTVDEIAESVLAIEEGTRLYALFPAFSNEPAAPEDGVAKPKKVAKKLKPGKAASQAGQSGLSDWRRVRLADLRARGFNRLYQNGKLVEFSTPESLLEIDFTQPLWILVDRIVTSPDVRGRIVDAAEIAYRESSEVIYETVPRPLADGSPSEEPARRFRFSNRFECKNCHTRSVEPEPRLFSFNNPFGACPRCQGFGNTLDFDLNLVLPNPGLTLDDGVIEPWTRPKYRPFHGEMRRAARAHGIPLDVPWEDLPDEQRQFILDGGDGFIGVHGFFAQLERKKYKLHVRVFLSKYRGYAICPECRGQRLRIEARSVKLDGKNICDAAALTITEAHQFFTSIHLSPAQQEIAGKILEEIQQRLTFLDQVGLEYLTLDRLAATLSGGESQRIQLATSLGSRLIGALYVLDEPSIGLHSRDTAKLIGILQDLRDLGNTILVVEHDPDVIRAADYLLDLGPGAGELGGRLLASGTVDEVLENSDSITGRYLSGALSIPVPQRRRVPDKHLRIVGARANNVRNLDCEIPLRMLVCVTGVSGSGKSTLVHEVLYKGLVYELGGPEAGQQPITYRQMVGAGFLNDVILVDQSPIGRTPRSNPVTYIKAFDAIRDLYASQADAKRRGYGAGYFSFNVAGGRCDVCQGDGTVTVEMQFLADVELPCEECGGKRYKQSVLEIKYKNRSIFDVLNLTVREALHFFAGHPKIVERLAVLEEVGLGYVRLGQSATTLSGGEAQRVKLAAHLASARNGASRTLYILDEPTTGLHFDDVSKLLLAMRKLIDNGGSLIVIEHNLDVIKCADWVLDLGPEGGAGGGKIVAQGRPEEVAAVPSSYTGQWLRRVLPSTTSQVSAEVIEIVEVSNR